MLDDVGGAWDWLWDELAQVNWQAGNISSWVAAVGTIGTLLFTLRLITRERRDRQDSEWDQARQVTVTCRSSSGPGPRGHWLDVRADVTNDSKSPIRLVAGSFGAGEVKHVVDPSSYIGPGAHLEMNHSWVDLPTEPLHPSALFVFTDVHDRWWRRTSQGRLERQPAPGSFSWFERMQGRYEMGRLAWSDMREKKKLAKAERKAQSAPSPQLTENRGETVSSDE